MDSDNFEDLLNESFSKLDHYYEAGEEVTGTVVNNDDELVFVDIGYKNEAVALITEFSSDELPTLRSTPKQFFISSVRGTEIELTTKIGAGFVSDELISYATENSLPVYGHVVSENSSGFEVMIGDKKAFCPKSQMSKTDLMAYENKNSTLLPFSVLEKKRGNYLVSTRVLRDEQQKIVTEKLAAELSVGDGGSGIVTRIEEYGIFVRLDSDLEGLVPRRELDISKFVTPTSFSIGDAVNITIIALDWNQNKHTFSIRSTQKDPWSHIGSTLSEGDTLSGRVSGFIPDGVFVEVVPGIDGFIHKSLLSKRKRINNPKELFSYGQTIEVSVLTIDEEKKRISLDYMSGEIDPWAGIDEDVRNTEKAIVEQKADRGLVVRLESGIEAFIPQSELSSRLEDSRYSVGSTLEVAIIEADKKSRRALASEKQHTEIREKEEMADFISEQNSAEHSSSLGAMLGDKFKDLNNKVKNNDKT
ncbi:MAG: S1 RNA-binding domain-containing protein [Spirochaetes bacterium]|jgi:small subunit ribosomal protein S1|nr:S1 RNA-binding domain-containing protein [Spirochaetota bacterium]